MYDALLMIDEVPEMISAGGVVYCNLRSGSQTISLAMPRHIYHEATNRAIELLSAPAGGHNVTRLPRRKRKA